MTEFDRKVMQDAADYAEVTMNKGYGGPFGAAIVKDGKVITIESNTVLRDNDPTAHTEINAIRRASGILKTHDLKGCKIYATGSPCPMCLAAIMWSNIETVVVSGSDKQAAEVGFRDEEMFDEFQKKDFPLEFVETDPEIAQDLYDEYKKNNFTIY